MDEFDLTIFKKSYDLYKVFYSYRNGVSKQERHSLYQRCENKILDMIENIALAGQEARGTKLPILEKGSANLSLIKVLVRLLKDIESIDNKQYVILQELIDEIGRMFGGWIRSLR